MKKKKLSLPQALALFILSPFDELLILFLLFMLGVNHEWQVFSIVLLLGLLWFFGTNPKQVKKLKRFLNE